jgi:dTDP-4-amino-4,6-dideoxygalactose transaminase
MLAVLRTRLPSLKNITSYLDSIDSNLIYSNEGPLFNKYKERLSARFEVNQDCILPLSSGTSALLAALLSTAIILNKDPKTLKVGLPAWSFAATLQVILMLGMQPIFIDVDETGYVSPEKVSAFINVNEDIRLDVFLAVAPFGRKIYYKDWERLSKTLGLQVVIDSASAFSSVEPTSLFTVVSTHATKIFSTAEGGILFCTDNNKLKIASSVSNFGFSSSRIPAMIGSNFKISEYSCAIGLSSDDLYEQNANHYQYLASVYSHAFSCEPLSSYFRPLGTSNPTTTFNIVSTQPDLFASSSIQQKLLSLYSIETKNWWPIPLSSLSLPPNFVENSRMSFPSSEFLSSQAIGLPMGVHIDDEKLNNVISSIYQCVADIN